MRSKMTTSFHQLMGWLVLAAAPALGQGMLPTTLNPGIIGEQYSQALTISSDPCNTRNWSVSSGALPAGITLQVTNPSTSGATLAGKPSVTGTFNFAVTATPGPGCGLSAPVPPVTTNYSLVVEDVFLMPHFLSDGVVGQAMTPTPVTTSPAFACSTVTSTGTLPPGITLNYVSSTYVGYQLSGTYTTPGSYSFTLTVTEGSCAGSFSPPRSRMSDYLVQVYGITTSTLPAATVNRPYSYWLQANGDPWSWFGENMPAGLTLTSGGEISGTPTAVGSSTLKANVYLSDLLTSRNLQLVVNPQPALTASTLPPAVQGQAYGPVTIPVTGGTGPLYFNVLNGNLPPGLGFYGGLLAARKGERAAPAMQPGTLYGTPTTPGNYSFTLQVTDMWGATAQQSYGVTVTQAQTVTTTSLPAGTVGTPYSATLAAAGFSGTPSWALTSGSLPAGLTLSSGGVISGTPTAVGSATFAVVASLGELVTPARTLSIVIGEPELTFTPMTLTMASLGVPYSVTFTGAGSTLGYTFSVVTGTLPAGLTLTPAGVLSGTPTASGTAMFTVQVASGQRATSRILTLKVDTAPLTLLPAKLDDGYVGTRYNAKLDAGGGRSPYTISLVSGGLPRGVYIDSQLGLLSGTPTLEGTYAFTIQVVDADGKKLTQSYTVPVYGALGIGNESLADATEGEAYTVELAVVGGKAPFEWVLADGVLPGGLALAKSGVLSGMPKGAGLSPFQVRLTDANGVSVVKAFTIRTYGALTILPETLPQGLPLTEYRVALVPGGGLGPYSFVLAGGALPEGVVLDDSGLLRGAPVKAGVSTFAVKLTDSRVRSVTKQYTIQVGEAPKLSLNGELPAGTAGVAYKATLTVTSGTAPYKWTANGPLPQGLTLDSGQGVIAGTPTALGKFDFTLRVEDANGLAASGPFSITISAGPVPAVKLTAGPAAGANDQINFSLTLASAYAMPLDGIVTLAFKPDTGFDDPSVVFANGGRTVTFTVPAGQTAANFSIAKTALQTGTVAGVITLTGSLSLAGKDVTPSPAPVQTLRIDAAAPVITRLDALRTATGVELTVYGFATSRAVTTATVKFTAVSGSTLAGTEFPVAVGTAFTTWYGSTASQPFGSQFKLVLPFTVSEPLALDGATVTLTNSVGTSAPATARF